MSNSSAKFELTGINHVIYPVTDVERSLRFYRDMLGIKQIPVMQPDVPRERMAWLQLPSGVMLHLIRSENVPATHPIHIAFEVADFDEAERVVKAAGLEVLQSGVRDDGQRFLFFYDPDENRVELCTPSGF